MKETAQTIPIDPRWGSEERPRKAEAIWRTMLHYSGPEIANDIWLDFGCGSGGIAATLAPLVERMIGIDPEPWSKWGEWSKKNPNLQFIQGSYDTEPPLLEANSVGVVICNQVYEHVPDPQRMIAEIYRILKPGGYCYFAGPNLLFPIEPHVFWPFVHWLPRKFAIWLMRACGSRAMLDAYSTDYWRLRRWLGRFEVQNVVPHMLCNPQAYLNTGLLWRALSKIPSTIIDLLTPLSPGFVFVLRKPEP